ncbi:MAG TPA: molybdopterin-binding protein, partial [Halobacteriales archaeon]|nr:molybdopterin-binding protein [Halobacteriales archaeon]
WLARQLTERGVTVARVLVVPDDRDVIADYVREWAEAFDGLVVTGGLGGTHDDVTMDAVADAFGLELAAEDVVVDDVVRTVAEYRDRNPEVVDRYDLDLDVDAWAATPEDSRPLLNEPGLCPGCVVENVYVFPGIPEEMRAMFESVADEFAGDAVSETVETDAPEGAMPDVIDEARDRFDVAVGSYPSQDGPNRVKVTGTDAEEVRSAAAWLEQRVSDW